MRLLSILTLLIWGCAPKQTESSSVSELSNIKKLKDTSREFLLDIGGVEIAEVNGIYWDPKAFAKKEYTAYQKWRKKFAEPKQCRLAEIFQINYQGQNLLALFSIPRTARVKKDSVAALSLPSHTLPFELDPKRILSYLAKGIHVLAISYEEKQEYDQALAAAHWLRQHVDGKLVILGKGLSAAPAAYAAAHSPHSHLILEQVLIKDPQKTKVWLNQVRGNILIVENFKEKPLTYFPKKSLLMHITGSYFGSYFGDTNPIWYENERDQNKLLKFLRE